MTEELKNLYVEAAEIGREGELLSRRSDRLLELLDALFAEAALEGKPRRLGEGGDR